MRDRKKVTYEYEDPETGEYVEEELPSRWEICSRCEGEGKHSNPNIDGHGITASEWWGPDWDDESREMYMSGGYDVACHACGGPGKVLVADESRMDEETRKRYEKYCEDRRADEAEAAYWRRLESWHER
jgi:hypothetical protein